MMRGVRRAEAVEVGGLEAAAWMKMYEHTHNGFVRTEWPDGGCYLKQKQITVDVFDLIQAEMRVYQKEKAKK
jgi:hypothetical protein